PGVPGLQFGPTSGILPVMCTENSAASRPLTAVLFDLFHTLIDLSAAPAHTSTPRLLGIEAAVWSRVVMEESPHHALGTEIDPVESIRRIAHRINPAIPMERILAAARCRPERFRAALLQVRPEVLELLGDLRRLGLRLGLISNAGLDEIACWPESPLATLIDTALFSCREGVMKPDPEIYLRAAGRLGARPADCLYVGDGASREHEGASAAGMHTVLMLAILNEVDPEAAASRRRNTRWVVDSFGEFRALVERLCRVGLPGAGPPA
ncbi:MAG: HAD family hydrolase, partial [Candidatus Eisenbacteria bacterium]